jgi:two-component system, LytTR family, response regulator
MSSDKIRSLIIDDDPFIQELLKDKLNQYIPEVEILTTANSGTEGLQKIATYKPGLIFLDVEMADMTGFEMLAQLEEINFQTIFITSYSHYAIKAIRFNALDYLVKPIDLGELKEAIGRYKDSVKSAPQQENLKLALQNLNTEDVSEHQLILQTQEGELRLVLKNIIRIEGERNYSYIYLKNDKKKLVTKTLADLEELLDEKGFFRCHRSHIINAGHIAGKPKSFSVTLSDGIELPISRRKKEDFFLWLEKY